jgi:hypothetical protein
MILMRVIFNNNTGQRAIFVKKSRRGGQVPPEHGMQRYSRTDRGLASVDFSVHDGDRFGLAPGFLRSIYPAEVNFVSVHVRERIRFRKEREKRETEAATVY